MVSTDFSMSSYIHSAHLLGFNLWATKVVVGAHTLLANDCVIHVLKGEQFTGHLRSAPFPITVLCIPYEMHC